MTARGYKNLQFTTKMSRVASPAAVAINVCSAAFWARRCGGLRSVVDRDYRPTGL